MPTDLPAQIRALVDATEPVSASEASRRARWTDGVGRSRARVIAVAAGVAAIAGASTGIVVASGGASSPRGPHTAAPLVLTAARVRHIVTATREATSSTGTAEVTELDEQNGTPVNDDSIAVTFDGTNIDEKVTVHAEPPGSTATFAVDDRLVNGQFYIYTPGPNDVLEWLHDTNSANDVASMQFPDPRTLYQAVAPSADLAVVGAGSGAGAGLTELRAEDPGAIDTRALGSLDHYKITSFELWIDASDVVQRLSFAASQASPERFCDLEPGQPERLREVHAAPVSGATGPRLVGPAAAYERLRKAGVTEHCGTETSSEQTDVEFANLGAPESVTAPAGAVNFAGKG